MLEGRNRSEVSGIGVWSGAYGDGGGGGDIMMAVVGIMALIGPP